MRKNLIKERSKSNFTQKQVAEYICVSESHYQKLEYGTSYGSVKNWLKLKELLGVISIDYLLKDE